MYTHYVVTVGACTKVIIPRTPLSTNNSVTNDKRMKYIFIGLPTLLQ